MSRQKSTSRVTWWRSTAWFAAAALLLAPLAAMQFTQEVAWTAFDFLVAAILLGAVCGSIELAIRTQRPRGVAAVSIAAISALAIVWINLAVGIVGSPGEPLNLMFFAIIAIGLVMTGLAFLRARTPSKALLATAAAQLAAAATALVLTNDIGAFVAMALAVPFLISARLLKGNRPFV